MVMATQIRKADSYIRKENGGSQINNCTEGTMCVSEKEGERERE